MEFDYIPNQILIDKDAILKNCLNLKKLYPNKKIFVAVKADAYGHGVKNVCPSALDAGIDGFCVAYVDEGMELRDNGIKEPILVLGSSDPRSASTAQHAGISLATPSLSWLKETIKYIDSDYSQKLKIHLAVDTGMGRIGITSVEELTEIVDFIENHLDILDLEGIFTHFATADADDNFYHTQQRRFTEAISHLRIKPKYIHSNNTAAAFLDEFKDSTNMIRMGIGLYGISPFIDGIQPPFELSPVMSLNSKISFIKKVSKGASISYGATYIAPKDEYIATVSIGYADGWLRRMKNFSLLVDGDFCPIVGRVTMDQLMIKVPRLYPIGTKVTLLGKNGDKEITAEDIANYADTIPYEIFTSFSKRVPRISI